jgi:hypothetical protein
MQISNFTLKAHGRLREIITDVSIYDAIHGEIATNNDPRVLKYKSIVGYWSLKLCYYTLLC